MTDRPRGFAGIGAALADRLAPMAREVMNRMELEARETLAASGVGLLWLAVTFCAATVALGFLGAALAVVLFDMLPTWGALAVIGLGFALVALIAQGRARANLAPPGDE